MTPKVGIFFDRASAELAVGSLRIVGVSPSSIHVLVPSSRPLATKLPMSGLPRDELLVYEDALRRGYAIVLVMPADSDERERAAAALETSGAQSVDVARERGRIGLRETEAFEYRAESLDFPRDEAIYREGFEAALSVTARERGQRDADALLKERYPGIHQDPAFRRGYARGRAHYRHLLANRWPRGGA